MYVCMYIYIYNSDNFICEKCSTASLTPLSNHFGCAVRIFVLSIWIVCPLQSVGMCLETSEEFGLGRRYSSNLAFRDLSVSPHSLHHMKKMECDTLGRSFFSLVMGSLAWTNCC